MIALLFLFIWVRASLGRPRYDQLMQFTWKLLLPVSIAYMAITALLAVLAEVGNHATSSWAT